MFVDLVDQFFRLMENFFLSFGNFDIGDGDSHARPAGIRESKLLHSIQDFGRLGVAIVPIGIGHQLAELFFIHENTQMPRAVLLPVGTQFWRQSLIEDQPAGCGVYQSIAFESDFDGGL